MGSRPTLTDEHEAVVNMLLSVVYGYAERSTVHNDDAGQKFRWLHAELYDSHADELSEQELQEFHEHELQQVDVHDALSE
jgi:hypothetical protein